MSIHEKRIDNNNAAALLLSINQWVALAGALFYQYNLATAFTRTLLAKLQGESLRRNAFWLLPYIYGLPHNAPFIRAAKINQMSSCAGFSSDFEDVAADGTTTYLMAQWREFLAQPIVTILSWVFVAVTIRQ